MIKKILLVSLLSTFAFSLNLNTLLDSVKKESQQELREERQRLQEFIDDKNKQKTILEEAKAKLKIAEDKTEALKKTIDENEALLEEKETELAAKSANLGEMFGSVRQTSADFLTSFQNSLTASQDPKKEEIFRKFANSKKLPNTKELETFWHTMLDEIIKSGNVAKYEADIILNSGEKVNQDVTRVGQFAVVSNGKYLTYSKDMNSLVELAVQPSNAVLERAKKFENTQEVANIVIDPTRGTLFEMIENNPTILDRIHQGGIVGYIILALGGLGLLFAHYKMLILNIKSIKIKSQMNHFKRDK